MLAPSLRGYAEAAALASLAFAGLAWGLPGSSVDLAGGTGDWVTSIVVWIGLVVLVRSARHLVPALPMPKLRIPRFRARAGTRVDMFQLWYGLVPTPGMAARYGDPDVIAIEDAGLRPGEVRLITQGAEGAGETLLELRDVEAPFHARLRTAEMDPDGRIAETGVSEVFLVELGPKRLVLLSQTFPEMSLGRAISAWLDDSPGRLLDRRLATIERLARAEDSLLAAPEAVRASRPRGVVAPNRAASGLAAHPAQSPVGTPTEPG